MPVWDAGPAPISVRASPGPGHHLLGSAARAAVPALGKKWVTIGHSQGAPQCWPSAKRSRPFVIPNYLGAIAVGIGGDLTTVFQAVNKTTNHGYFAFLAYGVKAVFPEFNYADWLTPEAIKLMPILNTGGWYVSLATYGTKLAIGHIVKPGWENNSTYRKFRELSLIGSRPGFAPVLLLTGLADLAVPPEAAKAAYERMRKQGPQWSIGRTPVSTMTR